jgi:hypothetical protein
MFGDDGNRDSFEEMIRAIAREVSRSVEDMTQEIDLDDIAGSVGVDPERARQWLDGAGQWLRSQTAGPQDSSPSPTPEPRNPEPRNPEPRNSEARNSEPRKPDPRRPTPGEDPLSNAGPHPLDLPTEEQGLALAALASNRWTVEPGSNALASQGEGPGPNDALGLVRELRVRDWIAADGEVTVVGRHALGRWLAAADPR